MLFSNDPRTEIAHFFTDPNDKLPDGRRPVLYLLRRDLKNQYGKESAPPAQVHSPLLTSLGMMVGFEILTKLWSGHISAGTQQIESFLHTVAGLSEERAAALTQFRHALAHGYHLETKRWRDRKDFTFVLSDSPTETECIQEISSGHFRVNLWRLKDLFLATVNEYKRLLDCSTELQGKFTVAKGNLGEIQIIP